MFSGEIIKPVVETGMFMVGKFNNWDAANPLALEQQEDGTFVANITFDTDLWNDFKFVTDNSGWETTTVLGADNEGSDYYTVEPELFDWPLNLVSPGANFRVPAGIYTITVAPALREEEEGYTVTISGQTITPETHIYVLGEIDGKTSADWTPYEGLEMTTDDYLHFSADITTTNDKNYFNFTKKLATDYDVEDGGWSQIAGYRFGAVADGTEFVVMPDQMGMPLSLGEDCDEPISFMLPAGQWNLQIDLESRTLTITGDYVMPETHVYILGEIDGKTSADWTPYEGLEMTTEDYIHFEANIATTNEINYFNFTKVLATDYDVEDGGWGQLAGNRFGAVTEGGFADPFVVTAEQMGLPLSLSQDCDEPTSFALPAGDWHLSLDLMARTLTITGDFPVPETHVYILGEVNDNGGWFPNVGTEMATDDYITFTANITTAGENWNEELMQGYSYFSFSKAFEFIMQCLEIPCTVVYGRLTQQEGVLSTTLGHEWNCVCIDGNWYHVDVTSALAVDGEDRLSRYRFLCVTTDEILKTHQIENPVPVPPCTDGSLEFFSMNGLKVDSYSRAAVEDAMLHAMSMGYGPVARFSNYMAFSQAIDDLFTHQGIFQAIKDATGLDVTSVDYRIDEQRMLIKIVV